MLSSSWVLNNMNKEKIRKHYTEERQIRRRIELATKGFTGKLITHNFKKIVNILAPYRKGEKIADIGCGFGYLMHFLPDYVRVCGIDLSLLALSVAGSFRSFSGVQTDAHNLPFREGSFDKLFCINLTPHLVDLKGALKECFRILKPNGLAMINFLNKHGLANLPFTILKIKRGLYFRDSLMTPSPQKSFSYHEMKKLVEEAGFTILETYGLGITFPYFLGQTIPWVAHKVTDYMIKNQDSLLIKLLSNAILFKIKK